MKRVTEARKSDMTSMIDMIFLLLIFFLVTLSIDSQPAGQNGSFKTIPKSVVNPKIGNFARVDWVAHILDTSADYRYLVANVNNVASMEAKIYALPGNPFSPTNLYDLQMLKDSLNYARTPADSFKTIGINADEICSMEQIVDLYNMAYSNKRMVKWLHCDRAQIWDVKIKPEGWVAQE